ncbi:MAG TPA: WecB/TagA/CpsF family glycosyltransferase [Bryobacteraceae bacterium]|nr:WecB/TagA/CpsF family glycosyltransferase [Bryobacteraceae bacterium]
MAANGTNPSKKIVLGVGVSTTSYQEVVDTCSRWAEERRAASGAAPLAARYVCVTSVHGIVLSVLDPELRGVFNRADVITPDGVPLVWALRSFGARSQQRVYGPNLMLELCARSERSGYRIFLYGGRQEALDLLTNNLRRRFPNLAIVGTYSPPFRPLTPAETEEIARRIRESGAEFVFVGLSTPKQDRWMAQVRGLLPETTLFGVGAAFDFHAGTLRQAPAWMQRHGLEWLFRLAMEPKRLWKRYVLVTPIFLPLWGLQKLGILRYQPSDTARA